MFYFRVSRSSAQGYTEKVTWRYAAFTSAKLCDYLRVPLRLNKVMEERSPCTCLKIMPDTEIIEKTSQFPGYFRIVNKESG